MSQTTPQNAETYAGVESLTESEYHQLMAVERRRTTLAVLAELSTPIYLNELAAAVVERETDREALDETSNGRIALELHHLHLPKMASLGIVDYDQETNRIVARS